MLTMAMGRPVSVSGIKQGDYLAQVALWGLSGPFFEVRGLLRGRILPLALAVA